MTPLAAPCWPIFQASATLMLKSAIASPSRVGIVRTTTWCVVSCSNCDNCFSSLSFLSGVRSPARSLTRPVKAGISRAVEDELSERKRINRKPSSRRRGRFRFMDGQRISKCARVAYSQFRSCYFSFFRNPSSSIALTMFASTIDAGSVFNTSDRVRPISARMVFMPSRVG